MRTTVLSLTLGLTVTGLFACGDDSSNTPIDAPKMIDAPKPIDAAPDAAHVFKGFDADEGGEVRAEYIKFPNGAFSSRVTAFLYKDSGATKFFTYLSLNGCTDMTAHDKWPMATNDITTRVYMDPGSVVITGGSQPLMVPRAAGTGGPPPVLKDPFARVHPSNAAFFKSPTDANNVPINDGANFFTANTAQDVVFGGSADMPATVYDGAMFFPSDFALNDTAHPHLGTVALPAATDQTFTFQVVAANQPAGLEVLSLVAFTGPKGPAVVCIEPQDGSVTVPGAMIDVVRAFYPNSAGPPQTIARQTLVHQVRELVDNNGPTGKRIDFIGVWCYAGTGFSTTP